MPYFLSLWQSEKTITSLRLSHHYGKSKAEQRNPRKKIRLVYHLRGSSAISEEPVYLISLIYLSPYYLNH